MVAANSTAGRPAEEREPDYERVDVDVRRPPTHVVSFRLNSSEMELLEEAAKEAGLKVSQYIRRVLFAAVSAPPSDSVDVYPGQARTFHWHSSTTPDVRTRSEPGEPAESDEALRPLYYSSVGAD
jgi:hypothetical protein